MSQRWRDAQHRLNPDVDVMCATCVYFEPTPGIDDRGVCHRFPPRPPQHPHPELGHLASFPMVPNEAICGEWTPEFKW